jgi:glycosyltransferase involved in cell wall biosynthesis/GR25 family glycosyltransferase involved in LPS biosynthesis
MKSNILKQANELFMSGSYQQAYNLYKRAAEVVGYKNLKYNLRLCEKNLGIAESDFCAGGSHCYSSFINEYFDCVYLVNLEGKHKNRITSARHLRENGIKFKLFNAVNGYQGEVMKHFEKYKAGPLANLQRYAEYNYLEVKRGGHLIESAGAMGYIYTYLSILKDAKSNNWRRFLILEDDIILSFDFENEFKKLINKIPDDWKVLNLGASQYGWKGFSEKEALENGYYLPVRRDGFGPCGSFAIAFDCSVVDDVIAAQEAFEAPFDHLPMSEIYNKNIGKCFVPFPNIVMPDVSDSSIRGKRDQYKHSELMKWKIDNFDYPLSRPSISILVSDKKALRYLSLFPNDRELAFELRLYYEVNGTIRPLHNVSVLDFEFNRNLSCSQPGVTMPKTDFVATIRPHAVLAEMDVVRFIEYKMGLCDVNKSCLESFNCQVAPIIEGRVSVIIPTYKRPENLASALKSVVEQDYNDIEVIVVSDNGIGSEYENETARIVAQYAYLNEKCSVTLITHDVNRNGAAARNTGILNSTGEYICFLDDDDIYLPGRISLSVKNLRGAPKTIGAVYCGFLGWNSPKNDLDRYKTGDLTEQILRLDYKSHYLHTNTATYKRSAVLQVNGFDESYRRHQDLEFNLRFFESYQVGAVKEALVRLNPAPSSIDNKVYGFDMVLLKLKFIRQFKYLIDGLGEDVSREILEKQFHELEKYSKGQILDHGLSLLRHELGVPLCATEKVQLVA